jgi:sugar phosphate isomerase/epimerase
MRIAISNIAWDTDEDPDVATLLNRLKLDAIDVAPGKYFPDPASVENTDIRKVRTWWHERGIQITGMQALLFGTKGLNMFADQAVQQKMLEHLWAVCRIAEGLGATRLVFGSPKNRDRTGLADAEAHDKAVHFFRRLGDVAQNHGLVVCLEPNPTRYGANFMTTSPETAAIAASVDHPSIRIQFDTGALTINSECPSRVLTSWAALVGHIHASEPDLKPLGDGETDHRLMHAALDRHLPNHVVSVEMLATAHEPHLAAIERALKVAISNYQPAG